jgi:hypothetical protein
MPVLAGLNEGFNSHRRQMANMLHIGLIRRAVACKAGKTIARRDSHDL